jgi:folate-binding protein YgfZ
LLPPESPWLATPNATWTIGSNCQLHPDGIAFAVHAPWISKTSKLLLIEPEHFSSLTSSMHSLIESNFEDRIGWEQSRIENFWPWFAVDFDDKNLPQELDIDARAISFKKGCYLGQETVARLDALGQVQKRLCLVDITTQPNDLAAMPAPTVGQTLHMDEKPTGTITSLVESPVEKHHWIALAMLKRSAFQTEASITTDERLTTTIRRAL